MNILNFILSVIFSLISCAVLAQDDIYELTFPIDSKMDNLNIDCRENDSTFKFKISPTKIKEANLNFTLGRGRRVVLTRSKKVVFAEDRSTYFSVILPSFMEGDRILISSKNSSKVHTIFPHSYYEAERYGSMTRNKYEKILSFESRLYENSKQIKWKESFVKSIKEKPNSAISYCQADSFFVKKLNDSSYFINSKVKKIEYILNEDIHEYWKDNDDEYNEQLSLNLGLKNDSLFFDEFYKQNVMVIRGKMDKETFKNLKKEYKKEIKSNRIKTDFYRQKPYLIILDFKDIDWNNKSEWLYYSIVWTKRGVLVILKTNTPFMNYFHYYEN